MQDRHGIGGNQPQMTETAREVAEQVNDWLREHPVISDEGMAREAKPLEDRLRLALADLDAERRGKVDPLNAEVTKINDSYRQPRGILEKIREELKSRLTRFALELRRKREAEAEAARKAAEEAERKAREAEAAEAEAVLEAEMGVETDILTASDEADAAFAEYAKANRIAQRAERDTNVKIGGGFGRALSIRSKEILTVTNWQSAIMLMGATEDIKEAICKSARAWRKLNGRLPAGVEAQIEEKI